MCNYLFISITTFKKLHLKTTFKQAYGRPWPPPAYAVYTRENDDNYGWPLNNRQMAAYWSCRYTRRFGNTLAIIPTKMSFTAHVIKKLLLLTSVLIVEFAENCWMCVIVCNGIYQVNTLSCCHLQEIAACKKTVSDLQQVAAEPAMGQSDLDVIKRKVSCFIRLAINGTIRPQCYVLIFILNMF